MRSGIDMAPSRIMELEFRAAVHHFVPVGKDSGGEGGLFRTDVLELAFFKFAVSVAYPLGDGEVFGTVGSRGQVLDFPNHALQQG